MTTSGLPSVFLVAVIFVLFLVKAFFVAQHELLSSIRYSSLLMQVPFVFRLFELDLSVDQSLTGSEDGKIPGEQFQGTD